MSGAETKWIQSGGWWTTGTATIIVGEVRCDAAKFLVKENFHLNAHTITFTSSASGGSGGSSNTLKFEKCAKLTSGKKISIGPNVTLSADDLFLCTPDLEVSGVVIATTNLHLVVNTRVINRGKIVGGARENKFEGDDWSNHGTLELCPKGMTTTTTNWSVRNLLNAGRITGGGPLTITAAENVSNTTGSITIDGHKLQLTCQSLTNEGKISAEIIDLHFSPTAPYPPSIVLKGEVSSQTRTTILADGRNLTIEGKVISAGTIAVKKLGYLQLVAGARLEGKNVSLDCYSLQVFPTAAVIATSTDVKDESKESEESKESKISTSETRAVLSSSVFFVIMAP